MTKIKIAFFLDVMLEGFDGVAITMHQVIRRIPKDQFDAIFITPQPPKSDIGFPVHICPALKVPEKDKEYLLAMPGRMKTLKGILEDFSPDLLHYSSPTLLGRFAVKYAGRNDLPVISIYHTHYPSFPEYYSKSLSFLKKLVIGLFHKIYNMYHETTRLLVPSKAMMDYLSNIGISEGSMSIWGRGVNTDTYNLAYRDEDYFNEIPKEHKKVLFVSRLVKEKDPDTLIGLYSLFRSNGDKITMIVVGEGPTKNYLMKNMPGAVFTGKLEGEALSKAYASSDVFVFPSTTETFGNVVLEALASGLPVVAANAGGPSSIVRDGYSGYLVKPGQPEVFYEKITQLTASDELRFKMSEEAVAYAKTQTWAKLSEQLFDTYKEIVSQEGSNRNS